MAHADATELETGPVAPRKIRLTVLLPGLGLVLLAALAYFNAVTHPFVYDDLLLVVKNPEIRTLSNVPEIIGFTEQGLRFNGRWTRTFTYALEFAAAGTWAPLYHLTNIALHAMVGLLAFTLIGRVSGSRLLGWWSAALIVVHPINTEVVAHVSGRRGLLAAFFSLLAMVLLERYTRRGGVWRIGMASIAIYLGVYSKELALMAPVAFVVVDLYGRFTRSADSAPPRPAWFAELWAHVRERRMLYGYLAVLTVCLGLSVVLTSDMVSLEGTPSVYASNGQALGPIGHLGLMGYGLRLLILPAGQSVDYSYDALNFNSAGMRAGEAVDLILVLFGTGLLAWGLLRRNWAGFGGAWFLLFYLPHLGIIPWHEVFAERFLYLPSMGVFVGLAAAGIAAYRRWNRPVAVAAVLVLAALTVATVARNEVWGSNLALWESAASRFPRCARAQKALADAYLAEMRPDLALGHYKAAVKIWPTYLDARTGVALAYTARRDYQTALETLDETLERWPQDAKSLNAKAYIYETLGDLAAAMEIYQRAVEYDPMFADGYNNLGRMYVAKGDIETAISMYEMAIERNPAMVTAFKNLAVVYREGLGDAEKADYYEERARQSAITR